MPDELDLIDALRQYERMTGNSNPFISRAAELDNIQPVSGPVMPQQPMMQMQGSPSDDYSNELMKRYMHQLDTLPVRNKPGVGRKIFAGLANLSSPKMADDVLYGPYNQQVEDWKLATDAIGRGASQERLYNTNIRLGNAQENTQRHQIATEGERNRHQLEVEDQGRAKIENAKARTAVYKYKAENPNGKIETDKEGRLVSINPQSGKAVYITAEDGSPVLSQHMSDEDKMNLGLTNDLTRIKAKEQSSQELENLKNTHELGQIGARGTESRETKQTIPGVNPLSHPGAGAAKPETPSQKATRWRNNANQFKMDNPDLAKWITVDGNNVSLHAPSSGGYFSSGPKEADYNKMKSAIFDVENKATPAKETIQQPTETIQATTPNKAEKTQMPAPERIQAAKSKLEAGHVLFTDGTKFMQVPSADAGKVKAPWIKVN